MRTGIGPAIAGHLNRPVVIGEYPYYRARPDRWAGNLRELRRHGIDVVSCYLPWRFHEVTTGAGQREFDFTGETDPQRDLVGLLGLAAEAKLAVLLKPGPFIHAEVQLGGLPDRLVDLDRVAYTGLAGLVRTSQAKPLPSLFDPATMAEVAVWLRAVADQVLKPHVAPSGPVVAVQIGNEGIFGDAHLPITWQDASPLVRSAFAAWLAARELEHPVDEVTGDSALWSPSLRAHWSRWSGQSITDGWDWLARQLPSDLPAVVNIPFAPASGPDPAIAAWAARHRAFGTAKQLRGHTEWIGNPARNWGAFWAHLVESRLGEADVLEANWGFTWSDPSFADPRAPMFNALLALMLGSTTVSVYTACSTESWGQVIDMDPVGLREEGVDPQLHIPPYCPGAPLTEGGGLGPTAEGLHRVTGFLGDFGTALLGSELLTDGVLLIDRELPEAQAWTEAEAPTALAQVVTGLGELLSHRDVLLDPRWLDEPAATSDSAADGLIRGVLRALPAGSETEAGPTGGELLLPIGKTPPGMISDYLESLLPGAAARRWTGSPGRVAVLRRRNPEQGIEFVGVFNPTDQDGRVSRIEEDVVDPHGHSNPARIDLAVPAGAAAVLVLRAGEICGEVRTPGW